MSADNQQERLELVNLEYKSLKLFGSYGIYER